MKTKSKSSGVKKQNFSFAKATHKSSGIPKREDVVTPVVTSAQKKRKIKKAKKDEAKKAQEQSEVKTEVKKVVSKVVKPEGANKRKAEEMSTEPMDEDVSPSDEKPAKKQKVILKLTPDELEFVFAAADKDALLQLALRDTYPGMLKILGFKHYGFARFDNAKNLENAIKKGPQVVHGSTVTVQHLKAPSPDGNAIIRFSQCKLLLGLLQPFFTSLSVVTDADTDRIKLHFADADFAKQAVALGSVTVSGIQIELEPFRLAHRQLFGSKTEIKSSKMKF